MIAVILVSRFVLSILLKFANTEPSMNTSSSVIVIGVASFEIVASALLGSVVVPAMTLNSE